VAQGLRAGGRGTIDDKTDLGRTGPFGYSVIRWEGCGRRSMYRQGYAASAAATLSRGSTKVVKRWPESPIAGPQGRQGFFSSPRCASTKMTSVASRAELAPRAREFRRFRGRTGIGGHPDRAGRSIGDPHRLRHSDSGDRLRPVPEVFHWLLLGQGAWPGRRRF